jgi:hypothetical protein
VDSVEILKHVVTAAVGVEIILPEMFKPVWADG